MTAIVFTFAQVGAEPIVFRSTMLTHLIGDLAGGAFGCGSKEITQADAERLDNIPGTELEIHPQELAAHCAAGAETYHLEQNYEGHQLVLEYIRLAKLSTLQLARDNQAYVVVTME